MRDQGRTEGVEQKRHQARRGAVELPGPPVGEVPQQERQQQYRQTSQEEQQVVVVVQGQKRGSHVPRVGPLPPEVRVVEVEAEVQRQQRQGAQDGDERWVFRDQAPLPGLQINVSDGQDRDLVVGRRGLARGEEYVDGEETEQGDD